MKTTPTILIVDDDEGHAILIRENLEAAGLRNPIEHFRDGQAILDFFAGRKAAHGRNAEESYLILLDIQLPREDGYTILQQIRTHPKLKTTRVVAVTANVMPQDEARARAAGFDGFIGKPLDFDRFPQQIQGLLQGEQVWMPR